jgi:polysaccharide pyruvyl transferase WcaK-like protein
MLGVKLVCLGVSFGPFSTRRRFVERIKHLLLFRNTARDPISIEYANQMGLQSFEYFPDFAFMLPEPPDTNQDMHRDNMPYVVMSFRKVKENDSYNHAVDEIVRRIAQTQMQDQNIVFATQVSFDMDRNNALCADLARTGVSTWCSSADSEQSLFELYRGATAVFSNRLHVLLFALRQGATAYAVINPTTNVKIAGLYQEIGLKDYIIDINDPSPSSLEFVKITPERLRNLFVAQRTAITCAFESLLKVKN